MRASWVARVYRFLADNMMLFYDEDEARQMFLEAGIEGIEVAYTGPRWKPNLAMVTRRVNPCRHWLRQYSGTIEG